MEERPRDLRASCPLKWKPAPAIFSPPSERPVTEDTAKVATSSLLAVINYFQTSSYSRDDYSGTHARPPEVALDRSRGSDRSVTAARTRTGVGWLFPKSAPRYTFARSPGCMCVGRECVCVCVCALAIVTGTQTSAACTSAFTSR